MAQTRGERDLSRWMAQLDTFQQTMPSEWPRYSFATLARGFVWSLRASPRLDLDYHD